MKTAKAITKRVALALALLAPASCTYPNEDHCWVTHGDATCRAIFRGGFCSSDRPDCEGYGVPYGCVAERPASDSCYSPQGHNRSCTDPNPDPECTGCGDGLVILGEECDDGNRINDDTCTNACTLAVCGDGIVSAANGETCDVHNTLDGDLCSSNCQTAGTPVWDAYYDIDDGSVDVGHVVEVDGTDRIDILAGSDGVPQLLQFEPNGALKWSIPACWSSEIGVRPSLALGDDDRIVVGCNPGTTVGQTRRFTSDGDADLTAGMPYLDSEVLAVAVVPGGDIVSAGVAGGAAILVRHDSSDGEAVWDDIGTSGRLGPMAIGKDGRVRVWHDGAEEVRAFDLSGDLRWESDAFEGAVNCRSMAIDGEGNLYVLIQVGTTNFSLRKLDANGGSLWAQTPDEPDTPEGADGVAVLPNGGAIVAGYRVVAGERRGRLTWFEPTGDISLDLVIEDADYVVEARLFDVAVSNSGEAVAVGSRIVEFGASELWVHKFVL